MALFRSFSDRRGRVSRQNRPRGLIVERLEDRCLLSYTITDLGTLGWNYSNATGLNDSGQVVGYSYYSGSPYEHAFLWDSTTGMHDLGTLGGKSSVAYGINASGQVVGTAKTAAADAHAFLWADGTMTDLGTLGGATSTAYSINNLGQVVGTAKTAAADAHAYLWKDGTMTDLGTLGGENSTASAINNPGHVVGYSTIPASSHYLAFLWDSGAMIPLARGQATAINDQDQMVLNARDHVFLLHGDTVTILGPGQATAINGAGQVVGTWNGHGYLYSDSTMTDLTDLLPEGAGWSIKGAGAINDAGQIVGHGYNPNGQDHAFLMTPAVSSQPHLDPLSTQVAAAQPLFPTISPSADLLANPVQPVQEGALTGQQVQPEVILPLMPLATARNAPDAVCGGVEWPGSDILVLNPGQPNP